MDPSIGVALIVAVVSPAVMAYLTNRHRRADKRLDWQREDEVAARAAEAAARLIEGNERMSKIAETSAIVLNEVHGLVNSNLTVAKQAQLDSMVALLLLMKRDVERTQDQNQDPSEAELQALADHQARVNALMDEVAERLRQTEAGKLAAGVSHVITQLDSIKRAAEGVAVDLAGQHQRADATAAADYGAAADAAARLTPTDVKALDDMTRQTEKPGP